VGLIAGQGHFPLEVARSIHGHGKRVVAAGLRELASPSLEAEVDSLEWLFLGEMNRLFEIFRAAGVKDVVMAGKVPKTFLWERPDAMRPDAVALRLLATMADRRDDSMLGAVAAAIEQEGFQLLGQAEMAPELLAQEGTLGQVHATDAQLRDVAFGWPVAKTLGDLDVGQTVVVNKGAVLALEAIEGTDAAIRRGCELGEEGACVIKVAKPAQDLRFDMPAIGPATVRTLAEGRGSVLAVEAGRTVVLERDALLREADACGIAVLGVSEASLARAASR
jgi:DUF1009 family protein